MTSAVDAEIAPVGMSLAYPLPLFAVSPPQTPAEFVVMPSSSGSGDGDSWVDGNVLETSVVTLNNVHKTYLLGIEGVPALRGVSVSINKGEFVTILGTSGGGKTTMLNIIGTIDKPTKGDVTICGTRITSETPDDKLAMLRLCKLGFVFQTFNLLSSMTALENVELPMILLGERSRGAIRQRAMELLQRVGLGDRVHHLPNQMSGGEQQRVTIARALANNPEVLLLDEPTGDLDTANTDLVMKILFDLNAKEGITLVMVTHDMVLKQFAHRVIRMIDGKVAKIEPVPSHVRRSRYGELCAAVRDHQLRKGTVREGIVAAGGVTAGLPMAVPVSMMHSPAVPQSARSDHSQSGSEDRDSSSTLRPEVSRNLTEVRQPANYPAIQAGMRDKGMMKAAASVFQTPLVTPKTFK